MTPTLEVRRNKKTGHFVLVNYAVNPKYQYTASAGEPICLSPPEMRDRGLETVLAGLGGFHQRECDEAGRMPIEWHRRFDAEHDLVNVYQDCPTKLTLEPMRRLRGGFEGTGDQLSLDMPSTSQAFDELLARAFSLTKRKKGGAGPV